MSTPFDPRTATVVVSQSSAWSLSGAVTATSDSGDLEGHVEIPIGFSAVPSRGSVVFGLC